MHDLRIICIKLKLCPIGISSLRLENASLTLFGERVTRIVCADSYFASVATLVELKRLGFAFIGVVKTATKQFPMAHLQSQELAGRGNLRAVVSKDAEGLNSMVAFVWVDRERRYFICNGGNLNRTTPVFRSQWQQVDDTPNAEPEHVALEIPQPEATHVYYSVCGKIDQSNRTRQDDLDIKKMLGTHKWDTRVNLSIFRIEVVDTYLEGKEANGLSSIQGPTVGADVEVGPNKKNLFWRFTVQSFNTTSKRKGLSAFVL